MFQALVRKHDILLVGIMSILGSLIFAIGSICFLYVFWNKLKEDYLPSTIFSVGFFVLIGVLAFFLSFKFLILPRVSLPQTVSPAGVIFWISLLGGLVGYSIGLVKFKIRFFESLEAYLAGGLYLILAVFVADAFVYLSVISLIAGTVTALLIILFYFLETRYRYFTWYKSGKVGFSGLLTSGLFFLIRSIVSLFYPFVLSFLGRSESVVSGMVAFLLFLAVYNLSQQ